MLKVRHNKEIHIFRTEGDTWRLEEVKGLVRQHFRAYPERFQLCYRDEDGDEIAVVSDEDLDSVFELERMIKGTANFKMVKLEVKQTTLEQVDELASVVKEEAEEEEFELLHSRQHSQYEELNSSQDRGAMSFVIDDDVANEESQLDVADIMRLNLEGIQSRCIEKVMQGIEEAMIAKEVDAYLLGLYQEIEEKEQKEIKREEVDSKTEQEVKESSHTDEHLVKLVEASLTKLLPSFLQRLSQKTIKSVKQILLTEQYLLQQ